MGDGNVRSTRSDTHAFIRTEAGLNGWGVCGSPRGRSKQAQLMLRIIDRRSERVVVGAGDGIKAVPWLSIFVSGARNCCSY